LRLEFALTPYHFHRQGSCDGLQLREIGFEQRNSRTLPDSSPAASTIRPPSGSGCGGGHRLPHLAPPGRGAVVNHQPAHLARRGRGAGAHHHQLPHLAPLARRGCRFPDNGRSSPAEGAIAVYHGVLQRVPQTHAPDTERTPTPLPNTCVPQNRVHTAPQTEQQKRPHTPPTPAQGIHRGNRGLRGSNVNICYCQVAHSPQGAGRNFRFY
jgi:hypothetical protein